MPSLNLGWQYPTWNEEEAPQSPGWSLMVCSRCRTVAGVSRNVLVTHITAGEAESFWRVHTPEESYYGLGTH